jgi:hypothetical protein
MAVHNILGIQVQGHMEPGTESVIKKVYNTFNFVRTPLSANASKASALTAFLASNFGTTATCFFNQLYC